MYHFGAAHKIQVLVLLCYPQASSFRAQSPLFIYLFIIFGTKIIVAEASIGFYLFLIQLELLDKKFRVYF